MATKTPNLGLIDITNSTHLSQHKSKINMCEFSERIAKIRNIDERLKASIDSNQ